LNITIGTTRGFRTRDYEVIQAVAAMLNNVGIRTEITTYTIPEFFDRRSRRGDLPALSLYYWSNSTAEPINSTGFSMWPNSPFSVWAGLKQAGKDDYTGLMQPALEKITPVFTEKDETKRIQLAKEAAIWVVEEGLVIPLYQVVVPYVMKRRLQYEPWPQGFILPQSMRWS
jgi:peptide/nickel transport system substrate-binding protein